jgi:hypothetical protein
MGRQEHNVIRSAAVALIAAAALTLPQGSRDLPRRLASRNAATQAGCRFAAVKGPTTEACILARVQADPMDVVVYERSADGAYTASNEMAIPSWSWEARLSLVDVLRRGTDWLVIDTVGMHGTGVHQRILLVIAWNGTSFRTVAAETLGYVCNPTATIGYKLIVDHSFATVDGTRSLKLKYELTNELARDKQRIGAWSDSLRWDAARFTFVPSRSAIGLSSPVVDSIRERIARVREYSVTRPFDPGRGSDRWIADSGLTDVLSPVCYQ